MGDVSIITERNFPFLDLDFVLDTSSELEFQVHCKNSYILKCLNKDITHTKATFKSIWTGVFNILEKLTSSREENSKMKLSK